MHDSARADDALRAIERDEVARSASATLVAALDGPPEIAARAALALGRSKRPEGLPPLRAHLASRVPDVRAMCAYGLGLLASATSLDDERALARHDPSSAVRYAAVDAIGRIVLAHPELGTAGVANDLLIVLRADGDSVVRAHAAAQFDALGAGPAAASLAPALERAMARERDEAVRWHVAWALYRGYARAADAAFLRASLEDRSELVRVETARTWGRRSGPAAARAARSAFDDPSWRVQLEAREAARRIAGQKPTEHLIADPPGLHLPAVANADPAADASPPPAVADGAKLAAPDPGSIPLPRLPPATDAAAFAAPAAGPHPRVLLATTRGEVVVRLYPEWAPVAVANFLNLAGRGYFDENRWFRIVPDFVVQTGDPHGDGEGDAGYTIGAEENPLEQRAGIIAMGLNYSGNAPLRDSAGTQFYVTLSPQLHLDRDFSVFGEIQSGFDVLARLVESDRIRYARRIADG